MLLGLVSLVSGCSDPTGPEEARLFRTVDQLFTQAREGIAYLTYVTSNLVPLAP